MWCMSVPQFIHCGALKPYQTHEKVKNNCNVNSKVDNRPS